MANKSFFDAAATNAIVAAITEAEAKTSGEIRLHVEALCEGDVLEKATAVFYRLKMNETRLGTGVLIYIAHQSKKFAIIGDKGINHVVPANFWDGIKEVMQQHFQQGEFLEGVLFAIRETGNHLKQYFPLGADDKNELPNEISEG